MVNIGNNSTSSPRFPTLRDINFSASPINTRVDSPFLTRRSDYHHPYSQLNFNPCNISDNLENIDPRLLIYLNITSNDGYNTPTHSGIFFPAMLKGNNGSDELSSRESSEKSSSGSSAVFGGTSVKVKDDVLVMDGVLVPSGKSRSNSGDSSGSSSGKSVYKRGCHSWEASGTCSYGSKCHFVHARQEQCQTRFPIKYPSEVQTNEYISALVSPKVRTAYHTTVPVTPKVIPQSASSTMTPDTPTETSRSSSSIMTPATPTGTSKCTSSTTKTTTIYQFASSTMKLATPTSTSRSTSSTSTQATPTRTSQSASWTTKPEFIHSHSDTNITPVYADWGPQDDGIEVSLPSTADNPPSREDVLSHIQDVLYGPTQGRKRLPVFAEICSDSD